MRPEAVRRLLSGSAPNPTLSNVLSLLGSLDLGLQLRPLATNNENAKHVLMGWLAHYGAPLYGPQNPGNPPPPEVVLADALVLARGSGSVARALPMAFLGARKKLDFDRLAKEAESRGQVRTLGFFLDLSAELSGHQTFATAASKLHVHPAATMTRPIQFFKPTTALERKLAEGRTPKVARKWGFRMNMDMDSFTSMFRKVAT